MAPWLSGPPTRDGREVKIGGPGKRELIKQILESLATRKVESLVVCSSSFDRDLGALKTLASLSRAKPICIVQPERTAIDGLAVQRLGKSVDWRPFVDPYPPEKRQRKDVRAHAKIMVFGHGSSETCVFGSANSSLPAFESTNTEVVVVLPPHRRGDTVKHLGLDASLKAKNIQKELSQSKWTLKKNDWDSNKFACLLSAVTAMEAGYHLYFVKGMPPKSALLALSDRNHGRPKAAVQIRKESDGFIGSSTKGDDPIRFAWVTNGTGAGLSNAITITWPTVASHYRKRHPGVMVSGASGMSEE